MYCLVPFGQFNASLVNKSINLFQKILLIPMIIQLNIINIKSFLMFKLNKKKMLCRYENTMVFLEIPFKCYDI